MASVWKIETWSRERGLGSVGCPSLGLVLPFDAAVAVVDDFTVGEDVLVELQPAGGSFKVRRVTPDIPRFTRPRGTEVPPPVDEATAAHARGLLLALPARDWDLVASLTEEQLVIEGHETSTYTPTLRYRLIIRAPSYVELPTRWDAARVVRLSTEDERAYVATRVQPDTWRSFSLTWLIGDRFYFVACHSLESLTLSR
jgi:hypothetical protein